MRAFLHMALTFAALVTLSRDAAAASRFWVCFFSGSFLNFHRILQNPCTTRSGQQANCRSLSDLIC